MAISALFGGFLAGVVAGFNTASALSGIVMFIGLAEAHLDVSDLDALVAFYDSLDGPRASRTHM